jgi:glutamate dehydrogenase
MTEVEFLTHKEEYVTDVLRILEKRAGEEADLIFKRYHLNQGAKEYTEISNAISKEINDYYNRFFNFFQDHPDLVNQMLYKKTLLHHLPAFIQKNKKFINRLGKIPNKIKYAILASEIATMIVYHQGWEMDFEERLKSYLKENLVEN